jgi:hypothetical protein
VRERWGAEHTVDKDLSTGAVAITSADGECWMKIELGKILFIHKIKIYYGFYTNWYKDAGNWCTEKVQHFINCVNSENNVDVAVYQRKVKQKSCGTLKLTSGLEQSDQIYTLICNTEGDTVKLSKDTGRIAVFELVVTGIGRSTIRQSWERGVRIVKSSISANNSSACFNITRLGYG